MIEKNFSVSRGVLQPASLTLDRPYSSGQCSRGIVSCCSDLALINIAKLSVGRQQLNGVAECINIDFKKFTGVVGAPISADGPAVTLRTTQFGR
jgi:hypothetical protein